MNATGTKPVSPKPRIVVVGTLNADYSIEIFNTRPDALRLLGADRRHELLRARRIKHLVVTQGALPTLAFAPEWTMEAPVCPVKPVDTVGAGDTFTGVLAAGLAAGLAWREAIERANTAAALSTLSLGAQSAMPDLARIEAALMHCPSEKLKVS
jgi:sugar/nucleoside kinase (ribokinase family)